MDSLAGLPPEVWDEHISLAIAHWQMDLPYDIPVDDLNRLHASFLKTVEYLLSKSDFDRMRERLHGEKAERDG